MARDLVLLVDELPAAGTGVPVHDLREMLGGANQAVGLAQLGDAPALVAVLGDDDTAGRLLAQARADGIDVEHVVRCAGCRTGLIVDIVEHGRWHYLEDLPNAVLLTEPDVTAAASAIHAAAATVVQL